eukprot:CAMPEP_0182871546 /NCGR_PEP_ID=MMETSP0034_2-20130328/11189_1 /TAXON_ID=156128 /ORGANISM="Nephroselmis pyriformis, Strain CCMP717" /LENGTH=162 /DNA_ID=CAMNT_0025004105 /DNA_START=17 /DNA_END=505 /DNA_ORIENTATION=-
MRILAALLAAIYLSAIPAAFAAAQPKETAVHVFDEISFDNTIEDVVFTLVEFYAPWCGHCKELAPKYEKLAAHFRAKHRKGEFMDVRIANFDLSDKDKTGDIAKRFMITSFPTIKVFKRGAFHKDYTGVREWKDMAVFMRQLSKEAQEARDAAKEAAAKEGP